MGPKPGLHCAQRGSCCRLRRFARFDLAAAAIATLFCCCASAASLAAAVHIALLLTLSNFRFDLVFSRSEIAWASGSTGHLLGRRIAVIVSLSAASSVSISVPPTNAILAARLNCRFIPAFARGQELRWPLGYSANVR